MDIKSARQAVERLCKWRMIFAGWQLGTRPDTDPECQAVRDHREVTMLLRAEVTALTRILVEHGIATPEELTIAVGEEAELLERDYQQRFPGAKATDVGMSIDARAAQWMGKWRL